MSIQNIYEVFGVTGSWILIGFGFLCGMAMIIINIIGLVKEKSK